jgi:hypothetical protein
MIFARPATAAESPRSIVEEAFVFHSATIMVHYSEANLLDENGNMLNSDASRPRVVKRGLEAVVTDKNQVEPDEIERIDHVCFVVHGIGEGWKGLDKSLSDCGNKRAFTFILKTIGYLFSIFKLTKSLI